MTGRPSGRRSDRSDRRDSREGRNLTQKVSEDERRRWEEQGLCYRCGKPGHMAKECHSGTQTTGRAQRAGSNTTATARVNQSTQSGRPADGPTGGLGEEPARKRQKNE